MTDRPRVTMRGVVHGTANAPAPTSPPEVRVKDLSDHLAVLDDVDAVRALQGADPRPTAAQHYERRLNELTAASGPEE